MPRQTGPLAPIRYLETQHKCWCERCGQIFYIIIGDVHADNPMMPATLRVSCPSCENMQRVESEAARLLGAYERSSKKRARNTIIREDCTCGQATTETLLAEINIVHNHLNSLKFAARSCVASWIADWHKAVMPEPMRQLVAVLKELDDGQADS